MATDAEWRALRAELADTRVLMRSVLRQIQEARPPVLGMAELRAHYKAWGEQRIKDELAARVGYRCGRGQTLAVHRALVDAIDAQLETEAREFLHGCHRVVA